LAYTYPDYGALGCPSLAQWLEEVPGNRAAIFLACAGNDLSESLTNLALSKGEDRVGNGPLVAELLHRPVVKSAISDNYIMNIIGGFRAAGTGQSWLPRLLDAKPAVFGPLNMDFELTSSYVRNPAEHAASLRGFIERGARFELPFGSEEEYHLSKWAGNVEDFVAIFGSKSMESNHAQWQVNVWDPTDLVEAFFSVYKTQFADDLEALRSHLCEFRNELGEEEESTQFIAALDPLTAFSKEELV
jgi:hypothetical protein